MKVNKTTHLLKTRLQVNHNLHAQAVEPVEPLPLAAGLLRNAPDKNGSALVARYQWQESCLISVGLQCQRGRLWRSERHAKFEFKIYKILNKILGQ